ncbi:hypothetical protein [Chryseobacterium sp. H1D6B]|uniref:hypothetical protein n=1 Tax=Chryseobacterium sp. H1D6B TaxID=2940588 RepID=UPI0024753FE5|nr:hypothetical protein [Chryseobacterium sp. H1D6B]
MNRKYNETKLEEDAKAIKESGKISDDEAKMMVGWIMMSKLGGKELSGKSYMDILNEAKNYKKQEEELAAKAKKEKQEKIERYNKAVTFTVFDKGFHTSNFSDGDYQDKITFDIAIQNKSGKEIRAMKGPLTFYDLFGEKLYEANYTQDTPIAANETFKSQVTLDYNQFTDELQTLKNKDIKDLKFEYVPEKIIFADGSEL